MTGNARGVLAALLACALPLLALGGCGGSSSSGNGVASKTPAEILAAAKQAADGASSVHVSGSVISGGSPVTLDMGLVAGEGGQGRLSQAGLEFELIQIGTTVYLKGSPGFYRHLAGEAAAQLLEGKWLKASSTSSQFASITSLTNLRTLLDKTLSEQVALAKGSTSTVDGQKVIALSDSSSGGTLYVATTGKPYPIEIAKTGVNGGMIVFDRWDSPVSLKAPVNAIDLAQLQATH